MGDGVNDKVGVLFSHSATQPPRGADTWVQGQIIGGLDRSQADVRVACAFGPPDAPTPTFGVVRLIPQIHLVAVDLGPERSSFARFGRVAAPLTYSAFRFVKSLRENKGYSSY